MIALKPAPFRLGQGHDHALAHVAALCAANRRSPDILARTGGDEFAMLLPETELAEAVHVAERLRAAVAKAPLSAPQGTVGNTISVGVAQATLSMPGVNPLMRSADQALYQAKARGRGRVVSACPAEPPNAHIAAE